jgi:DNA-binding MarR family transcriptional regulator
VKDLSPKQAELLAALLPRPLTPVDAAFQMQTSPQMAGRIMAALARKNLSFYDVLPGTTSRLEFGWTLTPEGESLARSNPAAGLEETASPRQTSRRPPPEAPR